MVNVYLDTAAVEDRDEQVDALALHAERIDGTWNGFPIPVATGQEFARFIAAWKWNDPNGSWGSVVEGDGALVFDDTEGIRETWCVCGMNAAGQPLYRIDGWTWSL